MRAKPVVSHSRLELAINPSLSERLLPGRSSSVAWPSQSIGSEKAAYPNIAAQWDLILPSRCFRSHAVLGEKRRRFRHDYSQQLLVLLSPLHCLGMAISANTALAPPPLLC